MLTRVVTGGISANHEDLPKVAESDPVHFPTVTAVAPDNILAKASAHIDRNNVDVGAGSAFLKKPPSGAQPSTFSGIDCCHILC